MSELDASAALMAKIGESVTGHRSFGPAFERDGTLVIPVAYVFGGGGGGLGEEPVKPSEGEGPKKGLGGGFGLVSWPIGAYVVQNGQVRWVPVIDPALILGAGGLALARVIKAIRGTKSRRQRRRERLARGM